ncbi:TonB-dependent receptor [candidate division KSB1 bacterium]|nr:TonB-dependent receptor [candidate division KSB1 bacterium]
MKGQRGVCLAAAIAIFLFHDFASAQPFGSIHGKVIDDTTAAPIAKADIVLEGTRRGASSDELGRFVLRKILPGAYILRVRFIGYNAVRHPIRLKAGDSVAVEIRLKRVLLQFPEISITASRASFQEKSLQMLPSVTRVSAGAIRRVPTVGEPDLFRALQTLPGITAPSQASNQLYIRGGSPDQNLVRVDGAPIYNPFHLFGLAANINPDVVDNVTVSTGGFPARYGDRLSGVVDVETRHVRERLLALGNVSLLSSKLLLGSRASSRLQWLVSGRRSYHDWAAKLFRKNLPYHFYDLFGKATFVLNRSHLFSFSAFYSADILYHTEKTSTEVFEVDAQNRLVQPPDRIGTIFRENRFGFPWNNLAANLRWEHALTPQWSSTVAMNFSRTRNTGSEEQAYTLSAGVPPKYIDLYYGSDQPIDWSVANTLQDVALLATTLWQPNEIWQVQAGAELSRVLCDYKWDGFDAEDSNIVLFFDGAPDTFAYRANYHRYGFFVECLWQFTPSLRLQPGLRWDHRSTTRDYSVDPRLSANWEINSNLHLQAAVGRYHQGLSFLREGGLFAVNELYFPMSFSSAATHFIAGLEHQPKSDTEVKLEAYYKNFDRQAVPIRALRSISQVGIAEGWAYGVEASARRGNWQAFYVFSHVRRKFNGLAYDTPWDVRHRFLTAGQIHIGKNWDLDFQWEFRTGQPYSPFDLKQRIPTVTFNPRTGRPEYGYEERAVDYPKGAIRYPIYHRLDVTLSKRLVTGKWSMAPYIQFLNLYNRKNPLFYEEQYTYRPSESLDPYVPVLKPVGVPVLPSFGVRFSF